MTEAGIPVAELVLTRTKSKKRALGTAKGDFVTTDDLHEPAPEIEGLFSK